jgi:uncharacterized phage protein (TIGR02218 family)
LNAALGAHLATGLTTVCQCWSVMRKDGVRYGFTDHDRPLSFGGITFRADSGLSARALVQGTGLAVDNSEAMGVLSDASLTEAEIEAGRFDGAGVEVWLVNWQDVEARQLRFRGTIGEIRRGAGAFHAELRGLTEALNQPQGRVYQRMCSAVLGDKSCKLDLTDSAFSAELLAKEVVGAQVFRFSALGNLAPRWFERGRLRVLTGVAAGLSGVIKHDQTDGAGQRVIELWEPVRAAVTAGDQVRLEAGCDKRAETCRFKFNNMLNFRGFPFVPGEDWLVSVPVSQDDNSGGRLPL